MPAKRLKGVPKPPYQWFGGKAAVADVVWRALGDVRHYIEPFFGGGAVFLARPTHHHRGIETINDFDGYVANFWRAVRANPDALTDAMDWPINELDLRARHRHLCRMPAKKKFLHKIAHDPEYYDLKKAAWWCWGLCSWVGRGWCDGEYWPNDPDRTNGAGMPALATNLPSMGGGRGIHRRTADPRLPTCESRRNWIRGWMNHLSNRLRTTRVCCGDWSRVVTTGVLSQGPTIGIFLDPPYSAEAGRHESIYREENLTVAHETRDWCIERTHDDNHRMSCAVGCALRIVLAGYEGEHNVLQEHGWSVFKWKSTGGMASGKDGSVGTANIMRERLWMSPSCLKLKSRKPLFGS